jgi:hypothetical protein
MILNYTTPYYFSFALGKNMKAATDMWVFEADTKRFS